jgi:hypothetical protein
MYFILSVGWVSSLRTWLRLEPRKVVNSEIISSIEIVAAITKPILPGMTQLAITIIAVTTGKDNPLAEEIIAPVRFASRSMVNNFTDFMFVIIKG